MKNCIFCEIYQKKSGVIYQNNFFYAQFDKFPVSPGHAEIIPIRHAVSILELNSDEWMVLQPTILAVKGLIEETSFREVYQSFLTNPLNENSEEFCRKILKHAGINKKPDAYNIGINEGEAAGRTVHHLHIHIIPRYWGDVEDYIGGVRHIIPGMGNYRNRK